MEDLTGEGEMVKTHPPPGISDTTHLMTDEQRPSSDYVLTAGTWKSYSEWEGACRVKLDMWCALQLCLCMELR